MSNKLMSSSCIILAILFFALLSGCGAVSDSDNLAGGWVLVSGTTNVKTFTLYEDGTCLVEDENGTWSISDGTLRIMGTWFGQMFWDHDTIIGSYELRRDTLTITDVILGGDPVDYSLVYEQA